MLKSTALGLFVGLAAGACWAQNVVPALSTGVENRPTIADHLITAAAVYGLPFGASEEEMIRRFGAPVGVIQMGEVRRAYLYGRSHALVFKRGRLYQLIVDRAVIPWKLAEMVGDDPAFDGEQWELQPGIRPLMSTEAVGTLLNKEVPRTYRWSYADAGAEIDLSFSAYRAQGAEQPDSFRLSGLTVTRVEENVASAIVSNDRTPPAATTGTQRPPPELITIDFDDAAVVVLAQFFQELTGKAHVVESGGGDKLTLRVQDPVKVSEAHALFVNTLQAAGYQVLDEGAEVTIRKNLGADSMGDRADQAPPADVQETDGYERQNSH